MQVWTCTETPKTLLHQRFRGFTYNNYLYTFLYTFVESQCYQCFKRF